MEFKNENGAIAANSKTGTAETQTATSKTANQKPAASQANVEPPVKIADNLKPVTNKATDTAKSENIGPTPSTPVVKELSLNDKLKLVNDLHRKSVQRLNLMTRIKQLEEFEVALAQDSDELADNPYQGCRLIIEDDNNREFVTTTPGLIRMVAQFIFNACNIKLAEIEATICFPN